VVEVGESEIIWEDNNIDGRLVMVLLLVALSSTLEDALAVEEQEEESDDPPVCFNEINEGGVTCPLVEWLSWARGGEANSYRMDDITSIPVFFHSKLVLFHASRVDMTASDIFTFLKLVVAVDSFRETVVLRIMLGSK
jgi:hypothetical protein